MTGALASLLNQALPDEKILADLWKALSDGGPKVELNDVWVEIPFKTEVEVVTKAYFLESLSNVGFGVYKVLLALGGFNQDPNGFHSAGICFSTIFYNHAAALITLDFHKEFR